MKRIGPDLKMPELKVPPFFADLYYDLRKRGLLPIVGLILVAIVAVPFLLGGGSEEEEEPATLSTAGPSVGRSLPLHRRRGEAGPAGLPQEARPSEADGSLQAALHGASARGHPASCASRGNVEHGKHDLLDDDGNSSSTTVESSPPGASGGGGANPGGSGEGQGIRLDVLRLRDRRAHLQGPGQAGRLHLEGQIRTGGRGQGTCPSTDQAAGRQVARSSPTWAPRSRARRCSSSPPKSNRSSAKRSASRATRPASCSKSTLNSR